MGLRLRVHADDLGASRSVSRAILEAYDLGQLDSASILTTGLDFPQAALESQNRPDLPLALHLNLVEGKPLTSAPLLMGKDGRFTGSASALLHSFLIQPSATRGAVYRELKAQFDKFCENFPRRAPWVDSHLHLHVLPFVFSCVKKLCDEYGVTRVRLPQRLIFLDGLKSESRLVQFGKQHLLSFLSSRLRTNCSLTKCDILITGVVSPEALDLTLKTLQRTCRNAEVEVLFHPAHEPDGQNLSDYQAGLLKAYLSPIRQQERHILSEARLNDVLVKYGWKTGSWRT